MNDRTCDDCKHRRYELWGDPYSCAKLEMSLRDAVAGQCGVERKFYSAAPPEEPRRKWRDWLAEREYFEAIAAWKRRHE